ncbi:MAG: hypothetical protein Q4F02_04290 [Candidatus Saccharibacteria bacterium]|nr:hypothetical protein [Candidatus Saccharibacteria bacterium]
MRHISSHSRHAGFTLVEMLVIIPVVIVIVTGLVVAIVGTTGSSMVTTARSQLQNDVLAALDRIEADVRLSLQLSRSSSDRVVLSNLATSGSPFSPGRQLIRKSNCTPVSTTSTVAISDALQYETNYYVSAENNLIRRTDYNCGGARDDYVWQINGDQEKILQSVKSMALSVTKVGGDALKVELTAGRHVAGRDIEFSGRMFVRSINIAG